ncbi:MAG: YfhO family protein [Ignavibacteria bacterium]|nr:YfhO family protein [Ignavibacteria bacterium]
MTKAGPKKSISKSKNVSDSKPIIPEKYHNLFYIAVIFLLVFIFFGSAIFGAGFNASDNVASESFKTYLESCKKDGNFAHWIPYIFSGMPGYASLLLTGARTWDFFFTIIFGAIGIFGKTFNSDLARVVTYYVIYGIGMYWLMLSKKQTKYVAFFVAVAAIFSTWVITWAMIGHNTKPIVLAMLPYIFLSIEKLREKISIYIVAFLVLVLHVFIEGGHLQMIFYSACAIGIYYVFEFISRLIKKAEPLNVIWSALMLALCFGLAFLMSADRYLSTMEYTEYSTRGSAPLKNIDEKVAQDKSGGNSYDYATMWSYSPGETVTFLIPSYFGYGMRHFTPQGASKEQAMLFPTYWGQKETEDSPPYMGIMVLALAVIGFIFYRKDIFVQSMFVIVLFSLFLSFGKNMPLLYDFFYNNVPSFNKFRAPSMSLVLMHFAVPILAGYGISAIIKFREEALELSKKYVNATFICSGIFLFLAIVFALIFKDSYIQAVSESNSIARYLQYFQNLPDFIYSKMIGDWFIAAFILIAFSLLIWAFIQKKMTSNYFFFALFAILVFDLWRIDFNRLEVSKENMNKEIFSKYEQIFAGLKQDDSIFRIADFASEHSNIAAYFELENINGYHSAKLRVYQDLMDLANSEGYEGSTSILHNPFLWNLMNVKYIIGTQRNEQTGEQAAQIYPNPEALPRAFFVDSIEVAEPLKILQNLKEGNFNPLNKAYIEKPLAIAIDSLEKDSLEEKTFVNFLEKKNEYMKLEAKASGNNFLFLSEIYYKPAWKAYIDGKEAEIIKTNYAFRGIVVPKGEHTIEFKYHSENFELGKTLSLSANILTLALGLVAVFFYWRKRKVELE